MSPCDSTFRQKIALKSHSWQTTPWQREYLVIEEEQSRQIVRKQDFLSRLVLNRPARYALPVTGLRVSTVAPLPRYFFMIRLFHIQTQTQ